MGRSNVYGLAVLVLASGVWGCTAAGRSTDAGSGVGMDAGPGDDAGTLLDGALGNDGGTVDAAGVGDAGGADAPITPTSTRVLYWDGCGAGACRTASIDSEVSELIADVMAEGGTVVTASSDDGLPDLTGYRIVVIGTPNAGLDAGQVARIVAFARAGGGLVLVGERGGFFDTANGAINGVLDALDPAHRARLAGDEAGQSGCNRDTTDLTAHPLTEGVRAVEHNLLSTVVVGAGATSLARIPEGTIVAVFDRVLVVGDSNFFIPGGVCGDLAPDANRRFFRNIYRRLASL